MYEKFTSFQAPAKRFSLIFMSFRGHEVLKSGRELLWWMTSYDQAYYLRKNSAAPNPSRTTPEKKRIFKYLIRFAFSVP